MDYPPGCIRDSIGFIIGVKASATVQVTIDGGCSDNDICTEKTYGVKGGLSVFCYCYCWDYLLGIRIT